MVICGGGLAGLTLARQLRREVPNASVALLEKTVRPLPEAAHKVGESSVELGSHYLETILGLGPYLRDRHLFKNGLRFFAGDPQQPLHTRMEIGPSAFPVVPSYQLDRGRLENDLRQFCADDGVQLLEGVRVDDIELGKGDAPHAVHITNGADTRQTLHATFVVDATGRRRLLQRKLNLQRESPIRASAAWFRLGDRIDVADLVASTRERWHQRDRDGNRWLSTNHLCGEGYWVWIIPLSTGHTSIGIVADARHPFDTFNTLERARAWLAAHEPHLWAHLKALEPVDFRCLKHYAYMSRQTFGPRFACVGEAGLFVDPLYSPGSDLIALANSFTTRLIADDLAGVDTTQRRAAFNKIYIDWAADTTVMLEGTGLLFARPQAFAAKVWWDFFHYWAFICQYFFQGIYRLPVAHHRPFVEVADRFSALNAGVQAMLRAWARHAVASLPSADDGPHIPLPLFPSTLADRHLDLRHTKNPDETRGAMEAALADGRQAAGELVVRALCGLSPAAAQALAGDPAVRDLWALGCAPAPARVAAEDLRGGARRRALPTVVRDMERALGRVRPPAGGLRARLRAAAAPEI